MCIRDRNWGNYNDPAQVVRKNKKIFRSKTPAASWSAELPASKDFKPRTDAVPAKTDVKSGSYLLFASTSKDFSDDKSIQSVAYVWVSNLNVVTRENGKTEGQVFDATSGNPIRGAKVAVYRWRQDGGNSHEEFVGNTTTCLLYTSPSPRDLSTSRMPSSA